VIWKSVRIMRDGEVYIQGRIARDHPIHVGGAIQYRPR